MSGSVSSNPNDFSESIISPSMSASRTATASGKSRFKNSYSCGRRRGSRRYRAAEFVLEPFVVQAEALDRVRAGDEVCNRLRVGVRRKRSVRLLPTARAFKRHAPRRLSQTLVADGVRDCSEPPDIIRAVVVEV